MSDTQLKVAIAAFAGALSSLVVYNVSVVVAEEASKEAKQKDDVKSLEQRVAAVQASLNQLLEAAGDEQVAGLEQLQSMRTKLDGMRDLVQRKKEEDIPAMQSVMTNVCKRLSGSVQSLSCDVLTM